MNQYYNDLENIQAGDIIFFRNSERINHTGYVVSSNESIVNTIEGNTSSVSAIVENGGIVASKSYFKSDIKSRFDGFGRPDYILALTTGWKLAADGNRWWFLYHDGNYLKNGLYEIQGLRYHFDDKGYMSTGQVVINGQRHEFVGDNPVKGAEYLINDTIDIMEVKT